MDAFAQYSPLFTSGLILSDNNSQPSSPKPSLKSRAKTTPRESVPLTVSSASFSVYAPYQTSEDAFFLTFKIPAVSTIIAVVKANIALLLDSLYVLPLHIRFDNEKHRHTDSSCQQKNNLDKTLTWI